MIKRTMGIAFSAIILAAAFGLAGTGTANAESVMKMCGDQWKAAKAAGTTNGQTWKEFLAQCRAQQKSGGAETTPATAPAAAPAPAPAPAAAAPAPAPTTSSAYKKPPVSRPTAAATGAGEFPTEAEAKSRCPSDNVVWMNTKSKTKAYHEAGSRYYGATKQGAYMCEADAKAAGGHAAKNEKPKT